MVAFAKEYAPKSEASERKNRARKNFFATPERRRADRRSARFPRREKADRFTKTASGMSFYGYRFYSPSQGRFLNRDPIGEFGGANLYAFVGNDPVNRWDLLGLFSGSGIIGPEEIFVLDKNFPDTQTESYSASGAVCWRTEGVLEIKGRHVGSSISVYPTSESREKNDSAVIAYTVFGKERKEVTVTRPKTATRTIGAGPDRVYALFGWVVGVRLDIKITDQFGDPIPEGITVHEDVDVVYSYGTAARFGWGEGSAVTGPDGGITDVWRLGMWRRGSFVIVDQRLMIGNWVSRTWTGTLYATPSWQGQTKTIFE